MVDTLQIVKDVEDHLVYGDKLKLIYELVDGYTLELAAQQSTNSVIGTTLEIVLSVLNSDGIEITHRFFNYDEEPIDLLHDHIEAIKNPYDLKAEEEYRLED